MGDLNKIVDITISRETQAVSVTSFGTLAIISEFPTDKTTTTFGRYRYYASLLEMVADGWSSSDEEYKAAVKAFSQNPVVDKIMIGRVDSGDASLSDALDVIQGETQDWYALIIIVTKTGKIVFDADLITGNNVDIVVNGTAVTTVPFNTDHDTTMDDIIAQIETDIPNSSASLDTGDVDNRTILIEVFETGVTTLTAVVTGGVSQAVATITFITIDDYKAVAAWTETQKKIFFYASSESGILDSGVSTDIASFMESQNYDRTISIYHTDAQEGASPAYIETGWPGECLPYDPGSQTWAYKTLAAVASYGLTSSQFTAATDKNCNVYTKTAGVDVTQDGKVASGEYIDVIRGLDWIEARLQEAVFAQLVNKRKIPYTDEGIALIENAVKGVLQDAADQGILIGTSIVVTVPKLADVPQADKVARNLPDVEFTANLQGAIHTVEINGIVTV